MQDIGLQVIPVGDVSKRSQCYEPGLRGEQTSSTSTLERLGEIHNNDPITTWLPCSGYTKTNLVLTGVWSGKALLVNFLNAKKWSYADFFDAKVCTWKSFSIVKVNTVSGLSVVAGKRPAEVSWYRSSVASLQKQKLIFMIWIPLVCTVTNGRPFELMGAFGQRLILWPRNITRPSLPKLVRKKWVLSHHCTWWNGMWWWPLRRQDLHDGAASKHSSHRNEAGSCPQVQSAVVRTSSLFHTHI